MTGRKTVYRAERAAVSADGKHVRLVKDVEGPHTDLYPDDPKHVARLSEEQAERLRDSLNKALSEKADQ